MPVTTIDIKTALIVVDLEKGVVNLPPIHPVSGVIECSCASIEAIQQPGLPVVLVNVAKRSPNK
jgi:hypothetical protein